MIRNRLLTISLVLILICVMIVPKICIVREAADATLIWKNEKEAYVFIRVVSRGLRMSFLRQLLEATKEYFGSVASPDNQQTHTEVLDLSRNGQPIVSKTDVDFTFSQIVGGHIFGGSSISNGSVQILKWTGTEFVPASNLEEQDLIEKQRISNTSPQPLGRDFDNVDQWSRRSNILTRTVLVKSGGESQKDMYTIKGKKQGGVITVERVRQGQSPEVIWTLNSNPRIVGGNEYRRIFHLN